MIFHLELLPGEKISEPQIAAKLQLSRTPVHNALLQLCAEGLVCLEPNKGATVMQFSDDEIRQLGTVRLSQDILSAELASYHGNAVDFNNLMALAEEGNKAAEEGNKYKRIKIDYEFHLKIVEIAGNSFLYRQQYKLYQQSYLIHVSHYTNIPDSLAQVSHHIPLVEAIRTGNIAEIRNLTCTHLKDFYKIDDYILNNFRQ